jgi:spore coat polysaccharide biosynthesis protein SpsF (cytidylyltransferase family)
MRTVAIIQARLASTRLPGKVLADLNGEPMISRMMGRLALAKTLDEIVLAIPDAQSDDILAAYCLTRGWAIFRGSERDVLGRYLAAAEATEADVVVRVTSDCPLIDPFLLDACVLLHRTGAYDFVANNLEPTFPHGLDCEVMTRGTLAIADRQAKLAYDREHVTPWITRAGAGGSIFRLCNLPCPQDLSMYRLTVDYPADLALVRAVYQHFQDLPYFTTNQILAFLGSHPVLMALNAKYRRTPVQEGHA